jgi:DNA-3-methyladenine glycosylase I
MTASAKTQLSKDKQPQRQQAQHQQSKCEWCLGDPLYESYHDNEWGVPCFNDRTLFEFLVLESAQAGLSWITILRKRENYRQVFDNFDVEKVAQFGQKKVGQLLQNPSIIRNKLKVHSTINNAKLYLTLQQQHGSFANYLWAFVDGKPIQNKWANFSEVPAFTPLAETISKDMKKKGFKFFGKTICYAFMQAIGMVNDHTTSCFRYREC